MKNERPDEWDRIRRQVYERDKYTCQNCGVRGGPSGSAELHAHHTVPLNKGGSNKLSNLITLCAACHDAVHHRSSVAPAALDGVGSYPPGADGFSQSDYPWVDPGDCELVSIDWEHWSDLFVSMCDHYGFEPPHPRIESAMRAIDAIAARRTAIQHRLAEADELRTDVDAATVSAYLASISAAADELDRLDSHRFTRVDSEEFRTGQSVFGKLLKPDQDRIKRENGESWKREFFEWVESHRNALGSEVRAFEIDVFTADDEQIAVESIADVQTVSRDGIVEDCRRATVALDSAAAQRHEKALMGLVEKNAYLRLRIRNTANAASEGYY